MARTMRVVRALGRVARAPFHWLLCTEGSTRALALIRMALVANAWARFSNEHILPRNLQPEALGVALAFFLSSSCTFFGILTKVSSFGFAACISYFVYVVGHVRGYEPYVHHHTTLLAWASLLLALSPCGKSYSVDRFLQVTWARRRGKDPPAEVANLWAQRLMVLLLCSVYFWAAYDKCNEPFFSGARMTHYLMAYYTGPTELSDIHPLLPQLMPVVAWAVVLLEFSLAFGLFSRRTRRVVFVPGLVLHGVFYFSLSVFTFSTTMWALYLAAIEPSDFERGKDFLEGRT